VRPPSPYPTSLNVGVCDSALDPNERVPTVNVQRRGTEAPLYRVRLYLVGDGLPFVQAVTYHLHETFDPPVRYVERTVENPNCELVIWTWGIFPVLAEIRDKRGAVYEVQHALTYGAELERGVRLVEATAPNVPVLRSAS
jgi:hypothetical protein